MTEDKEPTKIPGWKSEWSTVLILVFIITSGAVMLIAKAFGY